MRSSVQSKRRRISRKAMLSLQAALLSGSLLGRRGCLRLGRAISRMKDMRRRSPCRAGPRP